ncbi:hypothetical protein [Nostoc phage Nsp-JY21]
MTFDGARAFFGFLKWVGLLCSVIGGIALAVSIYDGSSFADVMIWASLLGAGLGVAATGMIGQMVACIATDAQALREMAQAKDRASRG